MEELTLMMMISMVGALENIKLNIIYWLKIYFTY